MPFLASQPTCSNLAVNGSGGAAVSLTFTGPVSKLEFYEQTFEGNTPQGLRYVWGSASAAAAATAMADGQPYNELPASGVFNLDMGGATPGPIWFRSNTVTASVLKVKVWYA